MAVKQKVAIVGSGVAGIVCAHYLQNRFDVEIFEKQNRIGGHTNTIVLNDGPDAGTGIDTGFIVLNDKTYPGFHQFLERLNVAVRFADMSFSYFNQNEQNGYAGTGLNGLFGVRSNIFSLRFWKLLYEIRDFSEQALLDLSLGENLEITLQDYLSRHRYSHRLRDQFILPMGAAIWSTSAGEMLKFPAITFIRFFKNHGLLAIRNRPRWQTVVGGSHSYLRAFENSFTGVIHRNSPVSEVIRENNKARIVANSKSFDDFDHVILASHADETLQMLPNATPAERDALSPWSYQVNRTVLHTDRSVVAPKRRLWASWNYVQAANAESSAPVSLSYHMNRLQGLKLQEDYFVTLNYPHKIDEKKIIKEIQYEHPTYSLDAIRSQPKFAALQGVQRTYFVGSYHGYGFHEDAVQSALRVVRLLGEPA